MQAGGGASQHRPWSPADRAFHTQEERCLLLPVKSSCAPVNFVPNVYYLRVIQCNTVNDACPFFSCIFHVGSVRYANPQRSPACPCHDFNLTCMYCRPLALVLYMASKAPGSQPRPPSLTLHCSWPGCPGLPEPELCCPRHRLLCQVTQAWASPFTLFFQCPTCWNALLASKCSLNCLVMSN